MLDFFQRIGRDALKKLELAGFAVLLFLRALGFLPNALVRMRTILRLCYEFGVQSMSVVMLFSAISGMVLAAQTGAQMVRWGMQDWLGAIVLISMFQELGPLMTAIILLGRVGSSMAAEIGTMAVSEEIEALETMAIDPVRFLVMPRIVTMILLGPILTMMAAIVGSFGGAFVGKAQVGVELIPYFRNAQWFMGVEHVTWGIGKGLVFAIVIAVVSCTYGLRTRGGALGVGRASRNTVVTALILIIILNFIITNLFIAIYSGTSPGT